MDATIAFGTDTEAVAGYITYNYPISAEMVNDLINAALDDGIGYWCESVKRIGEHRGDGPGWHLANGGVLEFTPAEGDPKVLMDLPAFLTAMTIHCAEKKWAPDEMHEQGDCEDADVIVQYALFEELRYA